MTERNVAFDIEGVHWVFTFYPSLSDEEDFDYAQLAIMRYYGGGFEGRLRAELSQVYGGHELVDLLDELAVRLVQGLPSSRRAVSCLVGVRCTPTGGFRSAQSAAFNFSSSMRKTSAHHSK
jgi:hypothetical protein